MAPNSYIIVVISLFTSGFYAQTGYKLCGPDRICLPRDLCEKSTYNGTESKCDHNEICCDILKKSVTNATSIPKEEHTGCGWLPNAGIVGRPGSNGANDETVFPWEVTISIKYLSNLYIPFCKGSLIAPNAVLTIASCFTYYPKSTLLAHFGVLDFLNQNNNNNNNRTVKKIIFNKGFKMIGVNDVAILILEKSFVLQENVRPICLPEHNVNLDYSDCYAISRQKNKIYGPIPEKVFNKIDLRLARPKTCGDYLRKMYLNKNYRFHKSSMCADGKNGTDVCRIDFGSPMICPIPGDENRYYQAGIASQVIWCQENAPGVYTNLSFLRPWISTKLAARGISFTHFTP